jgi:hypothetical protein
LQLASLPPLAEKRLFRDAVLPVRLVPRAKLFEQEALHKLRLGKAAGIFARIG